MNNVNRIWQIIREKWLLDSNFRNCFSHAWAEAMVPRNISAGFKTAGVYPLDSAAFVAHTAVSDSNGSLLPSSSLKFVPMYSPIAPKN